MSLQRIFARGQPDKENDAREDYKQEHITIRFFRSIAKPIIRIIYPIKFITPNRITWFSFLLSLIGALTLILADDNIFLLFLVALFYWLSALCDCIDGELARKRGITTKRGEWLDRILDEGKGFPFFIALGLHIQDANGFFTLTLASIKIGTFNVWLLLFLLFGAGGWLTLMSIYGKFILDESSIVSYANIYIVGFFLLFNLLDWFLVLFTVGVLLMVIYTLFEKTFLFVEPPKKNTSNNDDKYG